METGGSKNINQRNPGWIRRNKRKVLIGSLVLLLLGGWIGYKVLTGRIERKLQEQLTKAGFTFTYDNIHWHIFPIGASFDDLHLFTTRDSSILSLGLDHAKISFGLGDIIGGKWQSPSSISLRNGYLRIRPDSVSKMTEGKKPIKEDWEIPDINLRDIDVHTGKGDKTSFHIQLLSTSLAGRIKGDAYRYEVVKQPLRFTVTNCSIDTFFEYHGLQADLLEYDMTTQLIHCKNARIVPLVERAHLDRHEPHVSLHADLTVPEVVVSGVEWSFERLFWLRARKIELLRPVFHAYQNKDKPLKPGERPMPPWVDSMAVWFGIDTVQMIDGTLTYDFMPANHPKPARVVLDKWDMYWLDYGNDTIRPSTFGANGKIRWMKSIWMYGKVVFPYDDPKHSFIIDGHFEGGDFAVLNSVLCPTQGFYFTSGRCNSFKFSFTGDEDHIKGKAWVSFDDVKVAFCDEEKSDDSEAKAKDAKSNDPEAKDAKPNGKKQKDVKEGKEGKDVKDEKARTEKPKKDHPSHRIKVFVANTIAIRTSTHGNVWEVEVNVPRNDQQSVFSLWLKGMVAGLKDALVRG